MRNESASKSKRPKTAFRRFLVDLIIRYQETSKSKKPSPARDKKTNPLLLQTFLNPHNNLPQFWKIIFD